MRFDERYRRLGEARRFCAALQHSGDLDLREALAYGALEAASSELDAGVPDSRRQEQDLAAVR